MSLGHATMQPTVFFFPKTINVQRRLRQKTVTCTKSEQSTEDCNNYESDVTISLATWNAAIKELSWIFSDVPAARRYLKQFRLHPRLLQMHRAVHKYMWDQ